MICLRCFTLRILHHWHCAQTDLLIFVAWEVQNRVLNFATVASQPQWAVCSCNSLISRRVTGWSFGSRVCGLFSGVRGLWSGTRRPTIHKSSCFIGSNVRKCDRTVSFVQDGWASLMRKVSASESKSGLMFDTCPPLKDRALNKAEPQ